MPGGDRTGPMGYGPMSGRAAGYCAGYSVPGYAQPWGGRAGMGFRGGFGRGAGWGFRRGPRLGFRGYPPYAVAAPVYPMYGPAYSYQGAMDSKQEMDLLQSEAEDIKAELEAVQKRIAELEKENREQIETNYKKPPVQQLYAAGGFFNNRFVIKTELSLNLPLQVIIKDSGKFNKMKEEHFYENSYYFIWKGFTKRY